MGEFRTHPDPKEWDDYVDFESKSWPKKDRKHYWIIPSICFNCESACGILAYVDKETLQTVGAPARTVKSVHATILASLGIGEVRVRRRLRVAFFEGVITGTLRAARK